MIGSETVDAYFCLFGSKRWKCIVEHKLDTTRALISQKSIDYHPSKPIENWNNFLFWILAQNGTSFQIFNLSKAFDLEELERASWTQKTTRNILFFSNIYLGFSIQNTIYLTVCAVLSRYSSLRDKSERHLEISTGFPHAFCFKKILENINKIFIH